MQWVRYREKYSVSDEGHVYNRVRGTYLLPQQSGKNVSIGYKLDLYGTGKINRKAIKGLVFDLFKINLVPDDAWFKQVRQQVETWNYSNGKSSQFKESSKKQREYTCDGCGRIERMELRTKERVVQQHGKILCSYCRNKLHETGQEEPVYVADPYPHVYVQGAGGQECNGLILGLG